MKKNLFSLLLMLGFIFVISSMILSCSDGDEPSVEPDVPVNPDVPLPPNPTPIKWVENEVDGGERGVGIKVTSNTEHNFVFECTPGSKVQSVGCISFMPHVQLPVGKCRGRSTGNRGGSGRFNNGGYL